MADGFIELTPEILKTKEGVNELNRMLRFLYDYIGGDGVNQRIFSGYGSPLNVITADVGSLYMRLDGGANTGLYVKESGAGDASGWAAK